MKISIRFEGGIGDHICAIRFLPAIKELYPNAEFYGFSDTENNPAPSNIIKTFWPNLLKNIELIPNKKRKPFLVQTQYGIENNIGLFENIPDHISNKIINDYDKYYDLHIDSLRWLDYDFNWSKYFYTFPQPSIHIDQIALKNTICVNLFSDANKSNLMNKEYVSSLIKELSYNYNIIILATPQNIEFYDSCKNYAQIICEDLIGIAKIIKSSSLFLTLDSGPKFLGYCLGTPTLNYSAQLNKYLELPLSQIIRWQPFAHSVLPLYNDIKHTLHIIENSIKYKNNILPSLQTIDLDSLLHKKYFLKEII